MARSVLITLTAPPAIEEALVDWLLEIDSHAGFTSQKAHGHSSRAGDLTLAEQVAGRKNQVRFQLHIPEDGLPDFMAKLKQDFAGAGVHYWVAPLLDAGHV